MSVKHYSFFISLFLIPLLSKGQELYKHQWKDRVLLLLSETRQNDHFEEQISALASDSLGLGERRLIIYQILPDKYRLGFADTPWIQSSEIYQQFMTSGANFQIILVGLDGAIKLRKNKPVTPPYLFELIDAMPMRVNELRSGIGG